MTTEAVVTQGTSAAQEARKRREQETRPPTAEEIAAMRVRTKPLPAAREQDRQAQENCRANAHSLNQLYAKRAQVSGLAATGKLGEHEMIAAIAEQGVLDTAIRRGLAEGVRLDYACEQSKKKLDGLIAHQDYLIREEQRLRQLIAIDGPRSREIAKLEESIRRLRGMMGRDAQELAQVKRQIEALGE